MSDTVKEVLSERGKRYGSFETHACIAQNLKNFVISRQLYMPSIMIEGLEMICHKLARIVNGDPFYADSWVDIAGYATLVADYLTEKENETKTANEPASFEPSDGLKVPGLTDKASLQNLQSAASRGTKRNTKRRD